jgi:hypothetical protein
MNYLNRFKASAGRLYWQVSFSKNHKDLQKVIIALAFITFFIFELLTFTTALTFLSFNNNFIALLIIIAA